MRGCVEFVMYRVKVGKIFLPSFPLYLVHFIFLLIVPSSDYLLLNLGVILNPSVETENCVGWNVEFSALSDEH